jgi:hypothetical protein
MAVSLFAGRARNYTFTGRLSSIERASSPAPKRPAAMRPRSSMIAKRCRRHSPRADLPRRAERLSARAAEWAAPGSRLKIRQRERGIVLENAVDARDLGLG